ncbi:extracellular solute-binding protein [Streptomyces sp. NBC_01020]|uniref:ABC transporter substrate-binding protein n=1 Tax=Streptomyces sp. NBC_01306 TaxID=2903819 RepID=UPI00225C0082|nr:MULTISPECIES: extracellular solute-binding protein [unclassified Streptomyces]MCX4726281.1 extracellular solute-binding protein [Streptomyces sp. NBC_01306]WSV08916.1 extracellular solute-binding protein [Streptomyces sp. NBC_01020]WSX72209.1 extracellular solute-binding protein [Streptomyces sp. NBC_00932]
MASLAAAVLATATVVSGCGAAPTADAADSKAAKAESAADLGGMAALAKAAKKEGTLNVYALAPDWANYGEMISAFEKKYGIKVNNENPGGSSQQALNAAAKRKGQDRAVDALDLGTAYMQQAKAQKLLAPYKVTGWNGIPAAQKQADGSYLNNYGGYISIGCDAKAVTHCPKTFKDLLKPEYKDKVALNGNPGESSSALAAVFAASLANGGSLDDVQPGLDFFKELKKKGNYVPAESTLATIQKGETPISIDWDYLNLGYAAKLKAKGVDWKVTAPADGEYSNYYNQGVNKYAPHPAAARLWMEFLYSTEGQNIWLRGFSRPALLDVMEKNGTADKAAKALPHVEGTAKTASPAQEAKAKEAIVQGWAKAVS